MARPRRGKIRSWVEKRPMRLIVASAERLTRSSDGKIRRAQQRRQKLAYDYYDRLGEIRFAAAFHGQTLSKVRLYVGEIDDEGEIQESEDPKARELLERVQDPGGGRINLLTNYGIQSFLGGESMLTWTKTADDEAWEMLSAEEIIFEGGSYTRRSGPGVTPVILREPSGDEPAEGEAIVYRLWRRHPRWSDLSDSPMFAVLGLCEQLLLFQMDMSSVSKSRLAKAGWLLIPTEADPAPSTTATDDDPKEHPVLQDFRAAGEAILRDPDSAAAQLPVVTEMEGELIEKVRHIQIHDPAQEYPQMQVALDIVKRIAIGIDLPPEVLLGMTDANHWTAWQVEQQTWKTHLMPLAERLVYDLTAAYLRPAAEAEGIKNFGKLVIAYDAAALLTNPDKVGDAKDLHDRGAIGDEALREAAGFDDDDAMDEKEKRQWIGLQLNDIGLALGEDPTSQLPEPEPEPGDVTEEEKKPPDEADAEKKPDADPLVASILTAAEIGLRSARSKAGSKIRAHAQHRCPECVATIDGTAPTLVASALGHEQLVAIEAPGADVLVAGALGPFVESLGEWGVQATQAHALADLIERHAARTLFEEQPERLPPGFAASVRSALT